MQGVAVDPQAGRRFGLDPLARFQDLANQLFFHQRHDPLMQVGVGIVGLRHPQGNQLAAQGFEALAALTTTA